jgi:DNA-binding NarL/FixJ family response regulator
MISVSIVEDNDGLRRSLRSVLEDATGFKCLGSFPNGEEALIEIPKHPPNVVLMDINLPGISGIECVQRLRDLVPQTRFIIITVYRDNDMIFDALRAGASGYLLKRSTPKVIRDAVIDVHEGGSPMSSEVARKVVEAFQQPVAKRDATGAEQPELSSREREVLELLSQGMPDKLIADSLSLSQRTVRFHLGHIYAKLHVRSRVEAALKHSEAKSHPASPATPIR